MAPEVLTRRVLIIDDYADALESLELIVGAWGYDVECDTTGVGGLARFFARMPDVAIVDLALPDVDGCDVIRRMKAAAPGTFVVAHSGYHSLEMRARIAGADAFVLKPCLDALEEVLAQLPGALPLAKTRSDR